MLPYTIDEIKRRVIPVAQKYNLAAVYLFGSYARGEATEHSDIDIRIDKGNSKKLRSLLDVSGLRLDLIDALGHEVDLLTSLPYGPLSEKFIDNLKKDEVKIYGTIQ